jgi:serine/threonine protein kinase
MNAIELDHGTSDCIGLEASELVVAVEAYQEARRSGRPIDRQAFLTEHAAVADRLAVYLDALDLIQSVVEDSPPTHDLVEHQSPLGPGDVLGDFRIMREVGRGGMGVVYEAEQTWLPQRSVALKVIPAASTLDAGALRRFRIETHAAACLSHPNIVPVFSAGCERGIPFYSMPLIKGRSLAEILRIVRTDVDAAAQSIDSRVVHGISAHPWPVVVARIGLQAAEALEHAHSSGIVHRDIKPSNLIVDGLGKSWVTDFGLAHLAHEDTGPTRTGDLVGTLRYMSPEQIRGERCAADPRIDIYSLGATLYEACTLRPAFEASERSALLHRILNDDPPSPRSITPSVPRDLEIIILKAMDKLPAGRYATAREMADDLSRFLEDRPIRARRPSLAERLFRWSKRHRSLVATAIAGIVVSMGIGTITLWRAKKQVESNLIELKIARAKERMAFEGAFGINDFVTVPLLREATLRGIWDEHRRFQSYDQLITFYDGISRTFAPDDHQLEVVGKAAKRAGALRLSVGDAQGCDDYCRAIAVYETMAAKHPRAVWYRTELISILREHASRLSERGEQQAAAVYLHRAFEIADTLVADQDTKLPCFRKIATDQFHALLELASNDLDVSAAEQPTATRLTSWLNENP